MDYFEFIHQLFSYLCDFELGYYGMDRYQSGIIPSPSLPTPKLRRRRAHWRGCIFYRCIYRRAGRQAGVISHEWHLISHSLMAWHWEHTGDPGHQSFPSFFRSKFYEIQGLGLIESHSQAPKVWLEKKKGKEVWGRKKNLYWWLNSLNDTQTHVLSLWFMFFFF